MLEDNGHVTIGETWAGQQFVATIDPRKSGLVIFTEPKYREVEAKLYRVNDKEKAAREFKRTMIGYATELLADNTGSVLLPRELIEQSNISNGARLVDHQTYWQLV